MKHADNVTIKQRCRCLFLRSSIRVRPSLLQSRRGFCRLKLRLKAALGSPGSLDGTLGWVPSLHRGHRILIWIFKKPTYLTDFLHTPGVSGTFWRLISKMGVSSCTINGEAGVSLLVLTSGNLILVLWLFRLSIHLWLSHCWWKLLRPALKWRFWSGSWRKQPSLSRIWSASLQMPQGFFFPAPLQIRKHNPNALVDQKWHLVKWIKNATLPFQLHCYS